MSEPVHALPESRESREGDRQQPAGDGATTPDGTEAPAAPPMPSGAEDALVDRRVDVAVSAVAVAVGLVLIIASGDIRRGTIPDPIGSGGLPRLLGGFIVFVGGFLIVRRLIAWRRSPDHLVASEGGQADEAGHPASTLRPLGMLVAGWGWTFLLPRIGFLVSSSLLAITGLAAMRIRSPWKLVAVPVIFSLVIFLLFNRVFGIQFPAGPMELFLQDLIPRLD